MSITYSPYQEAVFNFAERGSGNAVVEAVAGSGKTFTMVEANKRIVRRGATIFLAFNKAIAEELKMRGVNGRTFHSLTYSPVTRAKNTREVIDNKLRRLVDSKMSGDDAVMYGAFVSKLVGLGKQCGIGCLIPDVEQAWLEIVRYHDLELENEKAELGRALDLAAELLHWSNESPMVDFDDLLYLAVKDGIVLPKFDFIFVDEAQDTNATQRAILRKIMNPGSRLIAVGDPAQAIYGFRGADSNSLAILAREFECVRLPLTVSYRCPVAVVKYAHKWVQHIEAAPSAIEGEVRHLDVDDWNLKTFRPKDLVVCRTTKPLIGLAFKMIKGRVPACIMGREIGQGLKALIGKMNASAIKDLEIKLDLWKQREIEKAVAKLQDSKVENIQDRADTVKCLIDGLGEDEQNIPALLFTIDKLFSQVENAVILATIHKSKGLEADRVFWLNSSQCPSKWAKQDWQKQQEANLCYVAVTRAKQSLFLIEEGGNKE